MKNLLLLYCLIAMLPADAHAQWESKGDYLWYWGATPHLPQFGGLTQTKIDFNGNAVAYVADTFALSFHVAYSSFTDSSGNLMVYTNGTSIANGFDEIIEGGDTLTLDTIERHFFKYGMRIVQGALLLPNPAHNGIFYLFHEEHQAAYDWFQGIMHNRIKQIYLTTIDMNANDGHGKVLEKSRVIAASDSLFCAGKILAVRHANGRDWWVTIPRYNANRLLRFLVTPSGVVSMPDAVVDHRIYAGGGVQQAAFSPDGSLYATVSTNIVTQLSYLDILDFDRCSGTFSNQFTLPIAIWPAGVFFSPDSRFLYLIFDGYITQFDLHLPNWSDYGINVYEWDGTMSPFSTVAAFGQAGPDGKVYIVGGNEVDVVHIVHHPNAQGLDCQIQQNVPLPSLNYVTVPNFPNYRLGPLDGSDCDSLDIDNEPVARWRYETDSLVPLQTSFVDLSFYEPATWSWDFGDGTAKSLEPNPQHVFAAPGEYEVCLTVSNAYGAHTACQMLHFETSGVIAASESLAVAISPNPFSDKLNITLQTPVTEQACLRLYDQLGHLVQTRFLDQETTTVDVKTLQPGLYFWKITTKTQGDRVGKLVKMAIGF